MLIIIIIIIIIDSCDHTLPPLHIYSMETK